MPYSRFLVFMVLLFQLQLIDLYGQGSCSDPGAILSGASTVLDPNSDGYFSTYSSSGFTLSKNEFTEFEVLTGSGGADVVWSRLSGQDPNDDLQSGGGCGNTDIVTDTDGGSDYAYYSVVDPDGSADNGDEFLAFAIRISNKTNGAFGFSYLMDSDNNCNTGDAGSVCGNPCFEYEIQLSTSNSGGTVELYNVDGCYGTSSCDAANGGDATICNPCNTQGIQVCVDSTACGNGGALWVYYIHFSQIPGVNSTASLSLTPASNTSGNQVIYKSANVSDYGGLDDINDIGSGSCGCTLTCSGSSCAKCEQDCAFSCAALANTVNPPLPVTWLDFKSEILENSVRLSWVVAHEINNQGYAIERRGEKGEFHEISFVKTAATGGERQVYWYEDFSYLRGKSYYRIKQIDHDGSYSYSSHIEIETRQDLPSLEYAPLVQEIHIRQLPRRRGNLKLFELTGKTIFSTAISGSQKIDLSVYGLKQGIYILYFEYGGRLLSRKMVIRPGGN